MGKIRIGECGYLTVADTGNPIKLSAMHIDVVNGGELQVSSKIERSKVLNFRLGHHHAGTKVTLTLSFMELVLSN